MIGVNKFLIVFGERFPNFARGNLIDHNFVFGIVLISLLAAGAQYYIYQCKDLRNLFTNSILISVIFTIAFIVSFLSSEIISSFQKNSYSYLFNVLQQGVPFFFFLFCLFMFIMYIVKRTFDHRYVSARL